MNTSTRLLLVALLLGLAGVATPAQAQSQTPTTDPIAVIVHMSNPINDLSADDLRRLFLGSITIFEHGERVILVESSADRTRFYRSALGMSEDRLKRHWIARVFAGQAGSPPQEIRDDTELRRYVATHPGAIAFVRASEMDRAVKVLTIDGRTPRDSDYPIR
jgi:ABC-type phosphate transport system substrate-binding protein